MDRTSCLFCRIADGDVDADRVLERDDLVAFRDINPQAPLHVLIVPREHIGSLNELREEHAGLVGRIHLAAQAVAASDGVAASGWRLVTNVGEAAGQSVDHLHFHVLGGRALGWPPG